MNPQETFVTRLRRQRMRARVSIEQIADSLRIKPEIIAAFEANDLSEWPKGLYSRAWVRAYALAVDLDPVDTVDEFCRLFPQGDRRRGGTIQEIAAIVASPSEYRDEFGHPEGRRASDQKPELRTEGGVACLRHAARPRAVDPTDGAGPSSAPAARRARRNTHARDQGLGSRDRYLDIGIGHVLIPIPDS